MDDMSSSSSWAQGFRGYEQIWDVFDMINSGSWAQGFRCYEYVKAMDDMN